MSKIEISLDAKPTQYLIHIEHGILDKIQDLMDFSVYSKIAIVLDENLHKYYAEKLKSWFPSDTKSIVIPAGESFKTLETLTKIWTEMLNLGLDRKSLVINFGGGVTGDMGGFASSTYMRGVDFIQIPTTLLAQVDASVGGKLGIDFGGFKNNLGVFTQPKTVIIDTQTLATLPNRELISGLSEMLKHGLIYDFEHFLKIQSLDTKVDFISQLEDLIKESCEIKASVVRLDPTEKGLRQILNFGHTIGHAVESFSHTITQTGMPLLHGEAVAIGIVGESYLSLKQGNITDQEFHSLESTIAKLGLPTRLNLIKDFNHQEIINELLKYMTKDKKNVSGKTKWVLLESLGKAIYSQEISDQDTLEALDYILS